MKIKYIFSIVLCIICTFTFSQADNCSFATSITPTATCSAPVSGTTAGATASISGCVGNADDDVWYKFVASATSHQITVTPSAGMDPVLQVFSGTCSTLSTINCIDNGNIGQAETAIVTGLTIGTTYTFRIFDYSAGSGSGTFTVCVIDLPPPPANNTCASAVALTVNAACSTTNGTSVGATQSQAGCTGTADDDVWYSFTATNSVQTITVDPSSLMDPVVELFSGSCGSLNSLYCIDDGLTNGNEVISAIGLTPGTVYFVRVYDYYSGNGGFPFTICVTGAPTAVPTNDEPCNAIALPTVTAACNYSNFTTVGSTASMGAPTPFSCFGGSGAAIGGFSASSHDVWFSVTVPATGDLTVTIKPWMGAGSITDGVMALYSGTCGSLTQIKCGDKYVSNPGTTQDELPVVNATGLTPGSTVFIRYWGFGSSQGTFAICAATTSNDACSTAIYICDINGYGGTTSSYYSVDRPSNMRGDNETLTYADTTDGIGVPSGGYNAGIFGLGGTWGSGQPAIKPYDVIINNNSWVRFTAANTTAILNVSVSNCWKDLATYGTNRGIQMQIFSGTNCTNFVPVSDYRENASGFTLTANSLTVGNDYYLMVDGFNSDVCNYTISANAGVLFPAITASGNPICYGASTVLTAPAGASSYEWFPTGQTTRVITASPSTTTTYTCVVGGVCGYKQTLTKTITVNSLPTVVVNSGNPVSVCNTSSVSLTATGASSYSWSTGATTSSISVSPSSFTTYTVTGTDSKGCKDTTTVDVTVKALPTIGVNSATMCSLLNATLTATGAATTSSYAWSNGTLATNTITVSPGSTTPYIVVGTAPNGCTNSATGTVTVLSLPNITSTSAIICNTQSATLTALGGATTSSYSWSNGATATNTITISPSALTSYTVTGTGGNGCTSTAVGTVTVNALPNVTVNSGTICNGQSILLNAGGANSYSWSNSSSGATINVNPSGATSYTVTGTDGNNCSNTAIANVTVNSVPTIVTTPTSTPSNCSASTGALTGINVSGTGALSYSWTNGSNVVVGNAADLINQPAGTYNVLVTDQNCSSLFGPYSIINPGAPSAPTVSAVSSSVCVGSAISLSATSAAPSPIFNWTGPNSSSSLSTLNIASATLADNGTYAVTVTSAGCTGPPATINITVNALPLASASTTPTVYCSGTTINLFSSGGTNYSWAGPNTYSSGVQNPTIASSTTAMSGTYTVTVTDANLCVNTATTNVTVDQTPANPTTSSNAPALCEGDSLQLNSSSTAGSTYSWSGPNGFSSANQNPIIDPVNVLNSGTYSVVATLSSCASSAATIAITINANPVAGANSSTATVCSGNTIQLTGSGGGAYSWSGPNGFISTNAIDSVPNSTLSANGVYSVIVTNAAGCKDTATVSVAVNQTPTTPTITTNPANLCEGESMQLNASSTAGSTYAWTGPNGFSSANQNPIINSVSILNSGTYNVVASSAFCSSATATINVTINPKPAANSSSNTSALCSGNTINISGTGGGTYSWSGPNGFTSSNAIDSISNSTIAASGTYTLIVTSTANCKDTTTVGIVVSQTPATPVVTANATNLCEGDSLQLNAISTAGSTYSWSGPNGYTSAIQNPLINIVTVSNSGNYSVIASSASCSSVAATIAITVNVNPVATASSTTLTACSGNSINLSGTGGGSYDWSGPNGFTSTNANDFITNATTSASGTYTLIVANAANCKDTATVDIAVSQSPSAPTANNVNTCSGAPLVLTANGTGTINWYSDAALTNLVQANSVTYVPTNTANTVATYYYTATNNGCTSSVASVTASNGNINASAFISDTIGFTPITINFTNTSTGIDASDNSLWLFGDGNSANSFNASNTYNTGGNYIVTLIVTETTTGCVDTAKYHVFYDGDSFIIIPNVFTPNGDGANEGLMIKSKGIKELGGEIYDRWGLKMFEWTNVNESWDGTTMNGKPAPDGTYFYIIKAVAFSGKEYIEKGSLQLAR